MMTQQQIINTIGQHTIDLKEAREDLTTAIAGKCKGSVLVQKTQIVNVLEQRIDAYDSVLRGGK